MWCPKCEIKTNQKICPMDGCHSETVPDIDIPIEVYWCSNCHVPIILDKSQVKSSVANKGHVTCPTCGSVLSYLSTDIRPVFPEERLLLELLENREIHSLQSSAVWAHENKYFINGKKHIVSLKKLALADTEYIKKSLRAHQADISYEHFEEEVSLFIHYNKKRLDYIVDEAREFIKLEAAKYHEENIVLSFSGGKDSTVVADIVIKALGNPSLVHIFGDTTLEFPMTIEYAKRYRRQHKLAEFLTAKNQEQVFLDVCKDIGPPARMMRWCCSMFKTGPITRVIYENYRNEQILTFYGIRKHESVSRSKYNRVEKASESVKIQQQTVAAPIFYWNDVDVWLYILTEKIDFNYAYHLGYDRVGCYCCPNNNSRAQFLTSIYMSDKAEIWRNFLLDFARKIGKPDAEEYVDSGKWKARQGGNGLASASDVKLQFTNCTSENHAKIYKLTRPYSQELINLFVPFGKLAPELGNKLLHEVLVLDIVTNVPILSIQPFRQDNYTEAVKIKTMNVKKHADLQRIAGYQVRKFNACRKCLKCESLCRSGAISILGDTYYINPDKCVHCKVCVNQKYLAGGCMMDKYLRTK